jgi:seryl-tRNA synthetase
MKKHDFWSMSNPLYWLVLIAVWASVGFVYQSCVSTDKGARHDVQLSAEQIGELRQQNRELTERVEREQEQREQLRDSLGRAESDAAAASDDIRGAIELLKQYKQYLDVYLNGGSNPQNETE